MQFIITGMKRFAPRTVAERGEAAASFPGSDTEMPLRIHPRVGNTYLLKQTVHVVDRQHLQGTGVSV